MDIREVNVNALKKIPLGSYVEGLLNVPKAKNFAGFQKVMTRHTYEGKINHAIKTKKINKEDAPLK